MALHGKVALVTGSTSGIGLGIARVLASHGAAIALNGFGDAGEIETLRRKLGDEFGVRVTYDGADLSRVSEVEALVRNTQNEHGGLDILVNNAGIQFTADIADFPAERWDAVIAINLSSVFHAMRVAIPGMKAKGWGRIINIASAHGLTASAQKSAYVAAKHAVVGLTKVAALELANAGVTANAICPGWVLTPLVERQLHDRARSKNTGFDVEKRDLVAEKQPMHEFTTPEQVGALAAFLCSDDARTITGAPLSIDGGWLAH
ncbi:MAG: 3-hydroxybutyrate dehydrogenase [Acetobacteraceae bacterium]|nr:3-hydroxybutyrate dehydrogenase [Acetobacteraceae bacterium]